VQRHAAATARAHRHGAGSARAGLFLNSGSQQGVLEEDKMPRSSAGASSGPTVDTDMPPVTCPGLHPRKLCKEKSCIRICGEELDHLSSHKNDTHIGPDLGNSPCS